MNLLSKLARSLPILAVLAGCAPAPKTAPPTAETSVAARFPADDLGCPVDLQAPARRVIVIGPGAVEIAFALGAQKQIVGRDSWPPVSPVARKIPVAGDYQGPNVEQSIALAPDLVIVQGETYDKNRARDWQNKIGVPVAVLTPRSLQEVRASIEKMGAWLGKSEAANALAATLKTPAPEKNGPSAFIEIGRSPLYTAGPDTLVGNVLEAAGFNNAAQIKGYAPYNVESLLAAPPDFYVVSSVKPKAQIVSELRKSPTLSKLSCIRKGRVIVMDGDLILRPGPRLKQGIAALQAERLANLLSKMRTGPTVTKGKSAR